MSANNTFQSLIASLREVESNITSQVSNIAFAEAYIQGMMVSD